MKRILSVFLCAILLTASASFADCEHKSPVNVSIDAPSSVRAGEDAIITVSIDSDELVLCALVRVYFDPDIVVSDEITVERGSFIQGLSFKYSLKTPGRVSAAFTSTVSRQGSGSLFIFNLPIAQDAPTCFTDFRVDIEELVGDDTITLLDFVLLDDADIHIPVFAADFVNPSLWLERYDDGTSPNALSIAVVISNASPLRSGSLSITYDKSAFSFLSAEARGAATVSAQNHENVTHIAFTLDTLPDSPTAICVVNFNIASGTQEGGYVFSPSDVKLFLEDTSMPLPCDIGAPLTVTLGSTAIYRTATFYAFDRTTILDTVTVLEGECAHSSVEPPTIGGMNFVGYDKVPEETPLYDDTAFYAIYMLKGDVNGDGQTNAGDASFLLRVFVNLEILDRFQSSNADVNMDGTLNTGDAATLLQFMAGLIPNLP